MDGNVQDVGISLAASCVYIPPSSKHVNDHKKSFADAELNWRRLRHTFRTFKNRFRKYQKKVHDQFLSELAEYFVQCINMQLFNNLVNLALVTLGCSVTEHVDMYELLKQKVHQNPELQKVKLVFLPALEGSSFEDTMLCLQRELVDEKMLEYSGLSNSRRWYQFLTWQSLVQAWENVHPDEQVIILLENLASFSADCLARLVSIIQRYSSRMKMHLLGFMPTAAASIQCIFNAHTLRKLSVRKFCARAAKDTFNELVHEVLIDNHIPIKLGPHTLDMLIDTFLLYDFSIHKTQELLHLCLFDHFHTQRFSFIIQNDENFTQNIALLPEKDITAIFLLNSLEHIPANQHAAGTLLKLYREYFEKVAIGIRECKAFYEICGKIPGSPFRHAFYTFYIAYLRNDAEFSRELAKLIQILGMLSREEWEARAESVAQMTINEESDVGNILAEQMEKLQKLMDQPEAKEITPKAVKPVRVSNLHELKRTMFADLSSPKPKNKFDTWKLETGKRLQDSIQQLTRPSQLPLHELFYYDSINLMRDCNAVAIRDRVIKHLKQPNTIITGSELKELSVEKIPDVCTLYRTYEESQMHINIRDWIESFRLSQEQNSSNCPSPVKRGRKSETGKKNVVQDDILPRFFSAMADLEYVGFIQKAIRKKDHVTKLVFN